MVSRSIDFILSWQRRNQKTIFGPNGRQNPRDGDDDNGDDDHFGSKTFLSQSVHGSRRHLRALASNALTIVSEFGKPTVFITLTCNPMWPEIQQQLLPGQSAFDRPDVVCQVFQHRLSAVLHNLRQGKYFDDEDDDGDVVVRRTVIYELRCIEYQHRGLPHTHIVISFNNVPDPNDKESCGQWIDKFISCELPVLNEKSSESDRQYLEAVTNSMTHTCSKNVNGCVNDQGICRKGYTHTVVTPKTTFCPKGYAVYKRRTPDDLLIVPHNRKLLLDWGGHAYVDWCGSTYTVLYLYKYLYKGATKVKFRLENADDVDDDDEITLYLRGRYLCSMDAVWRILGYHVSLSLTLTHSLTHFLYYLSLSFFS
jgi:hypothetical protein